MCTVHVLLLLFVLVMVVVVGLFWVFVVLRIGAICMSILFFLCNETFYVIDQWIRFE